MQDPRVRALCADLAGVQIGDVTGHQEVLQAIKGCYASLWTPHALASLVRRVVWALGEGQMQT